MDQATWTSCPHGPIVTLGEDLYRVEGSLPSGPPLKRVMTIVKRRSGKLLIHGAIALDAAGMAALEALGEPGELLVPSGFHRLDAPRYVARYPSLRVYCPRGARKRVEKVVPVTGTVDDLEADDQVRAIHFGGTGEQEACLFVRTPEGTTIVLNDMLFNMDHLPGLQGFILKHVTQSSGGPRVSRLARIGLVKDRAEARRAFEELARTPGLVRVIVAHHEDITGDPAGVLRRVAASLG
ncbi:MAG: hypothetical protein HOO96_11270 [Polyangiaceae bacterium]|nr:hypothetical protein [Polyangiaceae bacterium]